MRAQSSRRSRRFSSRRFRRSTNFGRPLGFRTFTRSPRCAPRRRDTPPTCATRGTCLTKRPMPRRPMSATRSTTGFRRSGSSAARRKTLADTIRALFDAPYHRVAFLQPGSPQIGTGIADDRVALDFEMNQVEGLTVSPCDGQGHVPSSWNGFETPNPLRAHGGQAVTGYPIVVAAFGAHPVQIADGSVSLKTDGRPVECYLNTPRNDDQLHSTLLLIPVHPLASGRYEAQAELTLANGTTKSIRWSFEVN